MILILMLICNTFRLNNERACSYAVTKRASLNVM